MEEKKKKSCTWIYVIILLISLLIAYNTGVSDTKNQYVNESPQHTDQEYDDLLACSNELQDVFDNVSSDVVGLGFEDDYNDLETAISNVQLETNNPPYDCSGLLN